MANDLSARMRMARLMGGGGGDSDGIRPVRRTSGTAVSDSAGGKVTVQLSDGDPIEVPTSVAVKAGQTVSLLVSGGVATAVGVAGWGDGVQAQADAAATTAAQASSTANTAKGTANAAQATANATATLIRQYADGVLVAKTGAKVGALVNASGSFDVVSLTWSDGVPSVAGTLSSFNADSATIGTEATPGASVDLVGGAARFYVKQWDSSDTGTREVRLNSNGATIIIGPEDEATNGGLWIDPYRSDGTGGKAGCEWPFDVGAGLSINSKAVKWQSAEVTLNTSSSLLGAHSASCLINPGLGLAYLSIDMSFESPGWQPGTGTWLFRLPPGLQPPSTKRLYNLLQIYINGRWGAHVDVHPDGYCYPTWGWQATNVMCNIVFPTALLGVS